MSFCTKCGDRLAGSSPFCTRCGAPQPASRAEPAASGRPVAEAAHQRRHQRQPPRWATIAVAAVMAAGLSALVSWRLTDHPATANAVTAGPPSTPATAGTGTRPPGTPATAGTGTRPPSTSPAPPLSSSPAPAPASAPAAGNGPVPVSPGAAEQASAGQVAAFLGTYFAAINDRDYQTYISLFDGPARPDRSVQQFLAGYRTTTDSDPVLAALTPTPTGEWAATVTFISHQSAAASPTNSSCTSWNITLYLEPSGNSYLIELPPPGYQVSRTAC